MWFELDLPEWILEDGKIVHQYVSLWPTEFGPDYGFESAICAAKVGNSTSGRVKGYFGTTSLADSTTWSGVSPRDINSDEKDDYSNYEAAGEWGYDTWDSYLSDENRVQNCVINLIMPKDERDASMFTEYTLVVGARVYDNADDT